MPGGTGMEITVMTPFPGTPLYQRLESQGRLLHPGAWELCTLFDVNFRPDGMSVDELERGFRDLLTRVYDAGFIEERRRRFFARQSELRAHQAN